MGGRGRGGAVTAVATATGGGRGRCVFGGSGASVRVLVGEEGRWRASSLDDSFTAGK